MRDSFREQHSALDRRLRNEYIEKSLNVVYDELESSAVADLIGDEAPKLSGIAYHAVAAEMVRGAIQLPEDLPDDAGLAVAAVRPGEYIDLSEDYWSHTASQKAKTLEMIKNWGSKESPESFYSESILEYVGEQYDLIDLDYIGAHAASLTISNVFSERSLNAHFYEPPKDSLAIIKYRPVLVLFMERGAKHANVDSVAHQLVHIRQMEDQPLVAVESQTSFDLSAMREELEAYHVGATLAERRLRYIGRNATGEYPNRESFTQISIDIIRRLNNAGNREDPYKPSEELNRALSDLMDQSELHPLFDFEAIRQDIQRQEAATDL